MTDLTRDQLPGWGFAHFVPSLASHMPWTVRVDQQLELAATEELAHRRRAYHRAVEAGKLHPAAAERRLSALERCRDYIRAWVSRGEEGTFLDDAHWAATVEALREDLVWIGTKLPGLVESRRIGRAESIRKANLIAGLHWLIFADHCRIPEDAVRAYAGPVSETMRQRFRGRHDYLTQHRAVKAEWAAETALIIAEQEQEIAA